MTKFLTVLMTPGSALPFFRSAAALAGAQRRLYFPPWSWRSYPQTDTTARQVYETYLTSARPGARQRMPAWLRLRLLAWQYNGLRRHFERHPDSVALCWNGLDRKRLLFAQAARDAGCRVLFAELAPFGGFVTLDPQGINARNSVPRHGDFFLKWAADHPEERGWRTPLDTLVARAPRRSKPTDAPPEVLPEGPYLFVPMQVPGDSQLRYYGDWVRDMDALLQAVDEAARHLPPGWHVRIKEHPSSRVAFSEAIRRLPSGRCHLANSQDTFEQVKVSQGVITVNSSVGLQSFAFGKPVLVLGEAFYGFEPLVQKVHSQAELNALLAQPSALSFDAPTREAYLRYLLQDYYLPLNMKQPEPLHPRTVARLQALLN